MDIKRLPYMGDQKRRRKRLRIGGVHPEGGAGQGTQGAPHGPFPELRLLNFLELYQHIVIPLRKTLNTRQRELGLNFTDIAVFTKLSLPTVKRILKGRDQNNETKTSLYSIYCTAKSLRLAMSVTLMDTDTGDLYATITDPSAMATIEKRLAASERRMLRLAAYYEKNEIESIEAKLMRGIILNPKECNTLLMNMRMAQGENERMKLWLQNIMTKEGEEVLEKAGDRV